MEKARHFRKIEDNKVYCSLCPHNCVIRTDSVGACRVRKNIGGDLYSLNYGEVASISLDPIEKKPLNRFHPGSMILSAGTFGCNLKCSFCQNWNIAHEIPDTIHVPAEVLVNKALELVPNGNIGIAYTYNEPSIWYEYVYDASKLSREKGLLNVLVTNGFISEEPLRELLEYTDALNIDVKGYTEGFYENVCKATLKNVKKTVEIAAEKCHVEITTLVIPDLNDSIDEIDELSRWIASISPKIPLHLSRFFPRYKMQDKLPTPVEILKKAREKALEHLKYVYLGNV